MSPGVPGQPSELPDSGHVLHGPRYTRTTPATDAIIRRIPKVADTVFPEALMLHLNTAAPPSSAARGPNGMRYRSGPTEQGAKGLLNAL